MRDIVLSAVMTAIAVGMSAPASAQLIRDASAKPQHPVTSYADFHARVARQLGAPQDPEKFVEGVPAPVIALFERYAGAAALPGEPPAGARDRAAAWKQKLAGIKAAGIRAEKAHSAYLARKAQVDPVVEDAGKKRAAGDLDGAEKTLLSVITPVDMDEEGLLKGVYRGAENIERFLMPQDAELPALELLSVVAVAANKRPLAAQACALEGSVRAVRDVKEDRYLMVADHLTEWFNHPNGITPEFDAWKDQKSAALLARKEALHPAHVRTCIDRVLGNAPVFHLGDGKSGKKGEWVVIGLRRDVNGKQKLDDRSMSFHDSVNIGLS